MKFSKTARDYYRLILNQRVDEINNRFRTDVKQLISRFQGNQYLANTRNKAVADIYMKYWKNVVDARIEAFIQAYEQDDRIFNNDDIESFLEELQSDSRRNWLSELLSQEKNEFGRTPFLGFNIAWPEILNATRDARLSIHRKGREQLLTAMKKKELEQMESQMSIKASLQGGIQVDESQDISPTFDEAIDSLLKLINDDATLDKYQKEDAVDALKKLPPLAQEEQTEIVIKRAKDKLEVVNSIISISRDLAEMASPYLPVIAQPFHLFSS